MKWRKSKKSKKSNTTITDNSPSKSPIFSSSGNGSGKRKSSHNKVSTPRRSRNKLPSSPLPKSPSTSTAAPTSTSTSTSTLQVQQLQQQQKPSSSLSSHSLPRTSTCTPTSITNSSTNSNSTNTTNTTNFIASSISSSSLTSLSSSSSNHLNMVQVQLQLRQGQQQQQQQQQQQEDQEVESNNSQHQVKVENNNNCDTNQRSTTSTATGTTTDDDNDNNNFIDTISEIEESSSSLSIFEECNEININLCDGDNDNNSNSSGNSSGGENDGSGSNKVKKNEGAIAASSTPTSSTLLPTHTRETKSDDPKFYVENKGKAKEKKKENEEIPQNEAKKKKAGLSNDVGNYLNLWVSDMNTLFTSTVFQNALVSTITLATAMSKSLIHFTFYPITKPIQLTTSMIHCTIYKTLFATNQILTKSNQFLLNRADLNTKIKIRRNMDTSTLGTKATTATTKEHSNQEDDNRLIIASPSIKTKTTTTTTTTTNHPDYSGTRNGSNSDNDAPLDGRVNVNNLLQDIAFHTVPAICNTTQGIINSSLSLLFSKESEKERGFSERPEEVKKKITNHTISQRDVQRLIIEEEEDEGEYIPLVYEEDICQSDEKQKQSSSIVADAAAVTKSEPESTITLQAEVNIPSRMTLLEEKHSEREGESYLHQKRAEPVSEEEHSENLSSSPLFYIRVCDLNIEQKEIDTYDEEKKDENINSSLMNGPKSELVFLDLQLSSVLSHLATTQITQTTDRIIRNGIRLTMNTSIDYDKISWKEEGSTSKILKRMNTYINEGKSWFHDPKVVKALEKETLLWSGSMGNTNSKNKNSNTPNYARKIPCFRAHGIIPSISPRELTELLLDSSRVKLYNKFSNGRDDILIFQNDLDTVNGKYGNGSLKVVQSTTSVPFSGNKITMTNLLSARPIKLNFSELNHCKNHEGNIASCEKKYDAYIIVSRSVYSHEEMKGIKTKNSAFATPGSRNEIFWGINILHEVPGYSNKTGMITFTQANSSAVPNFLAQKVGLMCAGDFIKNIRGMNLS